MNIRHRLFKNTDPSSIHFFSSLLRELFNKSPSLCPILSIIPAPLNTIQIRTQPTRNWSTSKIVREKQSLQATFCVSWNTLKASASVTRNNFLLGQLRLIRDAGEAEFVVGIFRGVLTGCFAVDWLFVDHKCLLIWSDYLMFLLSFWCCLRLGQYLIIQKQLKMIQDKMINTNTAKVSDGSFLF